MKEKTCFNCKLLSLALMGLSRYPVCNELDGKICPPESTCEKWVQGEVCVNHFDKHDARFWVDFFKSGLSAYGIEAVLEKLWIALVDKCAEEYLLGFRSVGKVKAGDICLYEDELYYFQGFEITGQHRNTVAAKFATITGERALVGVRFDSGEVRKVGTWAEIDKGRWGIKWDEGTQDVQDWLKRKFNLQIN